MGRPRQNNIGSGKSDCQLRWPQRLWHTEEERVDGERPIKPVRILRGAKSAAGESAIDGVAQGGQALVVTQDLFTAKGGGKILKHLVVAGCESQTLIQG